jgi:hypothetical protein
MGKSDVEYELMYETCYDGGEGSFSNVFEDV